HAGRHRRDGGVSRLARRPQHHRPIVQHRWRAGAELNPLPRLLARRLPFFYGWVILGCLCCVGFARQGPAVATLSIFVEPLTREFGWSRTALSGAVSLGGVLAAISSPLIGPLLDRRGARAILCTVVLVNGLLLTGLSLIGSLPAFYLLFCLARMNWAGPFDLGIYGAVSNWFVARRAFATSVATLAQMAGLVAMPLIGQFAISHSGWRSGWLALGILTVAVGFVPSYLFLVRRPEDLGLVPDRAGTAAAASPAAPETAYSRREALATPAFWLLLAYTMLVYPVQAGVSLHQAPHLIERGIAPAVAATIVSTFSLMSAAAAGALPARRDRRHPCRRHAGHAGDSHPARSLSRGGAVRLRRRRHPDPAAACLGGLFRPRPFRRDPRHRPVGAGAGPGGRTAAVGRVARLDRRLRALARMLCRLVAGQRRGRLAGAPAAPLERRGKRWLRNSILSSPAPARRGAASRRGSARTGATACCCWRRDRRTATPGFTCRWAMPSCSPIRSSTGCTRANPSPSSTTAPSTSRAARCWAAPARSTAWSICAATRPITTSGASAAAPAGTGTACCPISRRRKTRSAAPTRFTASAGRSTSATIRSDGNWPSTGSRRRSRRGCRPTTISTPASRTAPGISRTR